MNWQPKPEALQELISTFEAALSRDNAVQSQILQKLNSFHNEPDFSNYLTILLCDQKYSIEVRSQAGLALKNHIVLHFSNMTQDNINLIKMNIPNLIIDQTKHIRVTIGAVISMLLNRITIFRWEEVFYIILQHLNSNDLHRVLSGLTVLKIILEDCISDFEDENAEALLDSLILPVNKYVVSDQLSLKVLSLEIINVILSSLSIKEVHIQNILVGLYSLMQDNSADVHKELCKCFVSCLSLNPDTIIPNLNRISEYMFRMTQVDDENVSLNACEFWLSIAERQNISEYLRPYLGGLIPVLLKGMVYSEEELMEIEPLLDDTSVPDRDQDIKPHFHAPKDHDHKHIGSTGDDEDEDEDDALDDSKWNLRRCSAASLDTISVNFNDDILPVLLPLLSAELHHSDWVNRECGILALGAISEGCVIGMAPHAPTLLEYLINSLKDPKPLVRSIACWTISRYPTWYCETNSPAYAHLGRVIEELLRMCHDTNKKVQEAALSAVGTVELEAGENILPFMDVIVVQLSKAFSVCQRRNLNQLYDAISNLASIAGSEMAKQPIIEALMPPLIFKWNGVPDDSYDIFSLFECMTNVIVAFGEGFLPYAAPIYERCVKMILNNIQLKQLYNTNPNEYEDIDPDFTIVALDLIGGMVQGLGGRIKALSEGMQPALVYILASCIAAEDAGINQSAYALLGDMAQYCFDLLIPHLDEILKRTYDLFSINNGHSGIRSNICWSLGEVTLRWGESMKPYITELLKLFVPVLNDPKTDNSLKENLAVVIARFAIASPELVAPHLEHFAASWFGALEYVQDSAEKNSAFIGMCIMAKHNPKGLQNDFMKLCSCVEKIKYPDAELLHYLKETFIMFKSLVGDGWEQYKAEFPESTRNDLQVRFGV